MKYFLTPSLSILIQISIHGFLLLLKLIADFLCWTDCANNFMVKYYFATSSNQYWECFLARSWNWKNSRFALNLQTVWWDQFVANQSKSCNNRMNDFNKENCRSVQGYFKWIRQRITQEILDKNDHRFLLQRQI